jgi:hypothetical protein
VLKIQNYISCFEDVVQANFYLKSNLGIDSELSMLVLNNKEAIEVFSYSAAPRSNRKNPIVRETHGLVLYKDGDLLTKAYDHPIEVENINNLKNRDLKIFEVPDGKTMTVFNHEGNWKASTLTDVNGREYMKVSLPGMTFSDEIFRDITKLNLKLSHPELIYVFNFVSKYNTKIMPHFDQKAYLITVINRKTGLELDSSVIDNITNRHSLAKIMPLSAGWHRTLAPGVFVIDSNKERYFCNNPIYSAVLNALDSGLGASPLHIAKIVSACRDERDIDVVGLTFKKYEFMLDLLLEAKSEVATELHNLWQKSMSLVNSPREFADAIAHHPMNHILFHYKDNKIKSIRSAVHNLAPEKLISMVKERQPSKFSAYSKIIKLEDGGSI